MARPPKNPTFRKLPARYNGVAVPFMLSGLMSCIVSGISTVKVVGLEPGLTTAWVSAWLPSWLIAFPLLFVMLPLVRRIVGLFVEAPSK